MNSREVVDASHLSQEDRTEIFAEPSKMDIALLKEQYNCNKRKQMLQTRVVLFKKAPNNEEICGKSLVNMIPVNQEVKYPKVFEENFPVREIKFNFVDDLDSDKTPWRTHLGIHRMTSVTGNLLKTSDTMASTTTSNPSSNQDLTLESTESKEVDSIASENLNGCQFLDSGGRSEQVTPASRNLSSSWSECSLPSVSSHYYPFPQRKCPKKSEAARKLGMYSASSSSGSEP
ncbi:uncharacterized protein C9orf152-like [Conger conger]|uniref:uncharacterized protein C9orf152-like n=1 Tax=Conger conger TaxID=82655 RepID=UPI002A5A3CBB|nr:uncharacterized protein C9orf152-like [Conger conger]